MTASFADNEIWHVLVDTDDMKRMNVEQLDDAFRLSLVDASTLVWKAGMKTWQRLGSVAGIDDDEEEEEETRLMRLPPPPPPPISAPRRPAPAMATGSQNPFLAPASTFAAHNPFAPIAANPFAATAPAPYATPFAAPVALKAPVYAPPLRAPDPYVLPKRRAELASEVDFRRKPGGFRLGRWLLVGLLITGGVLALYRQNLLREGARRIGLENKYLYGERRVTGYVDAKAPPAVKRVLAQLALLPGPNAIATSPNPVTAPAPVAKPAPATPAAPAAPASATEPARSPAENVSTVSLDSLPVEPGAASPTATTPKAAPEPQAASVTRAAPVVASAPRAKTAAKAAKPAPAPKAAKVEKPAVEKPKAAPKPAPAPADDNPLKAAIRSAIAADAAKKK